MLLLFVLMICDAPFRNGQQQFVLLRVGKQRWIAAQLLYLLFLSVLFTVFLWVLSWVFLWPNLEWAGDWGKVLQTAARTGAHGDYANVILSPQMIKGTTPAVVTVWTGCMMVGVCFLLGEVVLLCNLWCRKGLGTAIAVGLVIVHSVIRMFSYFRYYHVWTWFSPVSWMDPGTTTITAVSNLDPSFTAQATVTVEALPITVEGVLQTEEGSPVRFTWDMTRDNTWTAGIELDTDVLAAPMRRRQRAPIQTAQRD